VPFFLISILTEAPRVPLRKTTSRFLERRLTSFSKKVPVPFKKLRRAIYFPLRKQNPPLIFLSGVFLTMVNTPSAVSLTLNRWDEKCTCHLPIFKSLGPNTVWSAYTGAKTAEMIKRIVKRESIFLDIVLPPLKIKKLLRQKIRNSL